MNSLIHTLIAATINSLENTRNRSQPIKIKPGGSVRVHRNPCTNKRQDPCMNSEAVCREGALLTFSNQNKNCRFFSTERSFCCIPCVIDIDITESVENLMMAEKHRAAAAVKNGMSLSADSTDSWCHAKAKSRDGYIRGRIINRSAYKKVLLELAGDKKKERALKIVYGKAQTRPVIWTTGL